MRAGIVILPVDRWSRAAASWRWAEDVGFDSAWTYDHLSWRSFREQPWFGAVTTLTAAAAVTERIRLGTMVTSPNFRHPVTLAKDVMGIDDVSGGRFTLGVGAGGTGFDATALGQRQWSARERADRFAEFVELTDRLLTDPATTYEGRFYSADEARMIPGCVQTPRVPFAIAATGPRGMALAARHGQAWVTFGDAERAGELTPDECLATVSTQVARLTDACVRAGRDVEDLDRILLTGSTRERPLESVDAFVDFAGRYAEAGITELLLHQPIPDSPFATDRTVFEQIADKALPQIR
ncbi:LLM class flavin-dependent oxidoreductase [Streptomyces sp. SID3343]|uniref:LLM class flavin-dependent oxidoreductase n=1 Tax=Streptomyces sp. SID3343 TaxID=2690260 RepID=UPI0013C279C5|nr:LLM class flavin-dependent oxidoreductase [Streptomyces sp. SID3343]MYV96850.1 LLM class flavin-dependent oxidoreductase [Streptomyces sp. SID3343]